MRKVCRSIGFAWGFFWAFLRLLELSLQMMGGLHLSGFRHSTALIPFLFMTDMIELALSTTVLVLLLVLVSVSVRVGLDDGM